MSKVFNSIPRLCYSKSRKIRQCFFRPFFWLIHIAMMSVAHCGMGMTMASKFGITAQFSSCFIFPSATHSLNLGVAKRREVLPE
jgi:hypothetical protein